MVKKKSFAVWMVKDVANTVREVGNEISSGVQASGILTQSPPTNVHQPNSPNSQGIAPNPTQPTKKLITGTRVHNWRDRLKNRQILSQPVEEKDGQEVPQPTKPRRIFSPPNKPITPTTPKLDNIFNRCINCQMNYQPFDAKTCPFCNFLIPDYAKIRGTKKTDMSLG